MAQKHVHLRGLGTHYHDSLLMYCKLRGGHGRGHRLNRLAHAAMNVLGVHEAMTREKVHAHFEGSRAVHGARPFRASDFPDWVGRGQMRHGRAAARSWAAGLEGMEAHLGGHRDEHDEPPDSLSAVAVAGFAGYLAQHQLEPGFLACTKLAVQAVGGMPALPLPELRTLVDGVRQQQPRPVFTPEEADYWATDLTLHAALGHLAMWLATTAAA